MKTRFLAVLAALSIWAGMAGAVVDINTAGRAELDRLKGIGPAKAQAIIDYRRKNGPFATVDDLLKVPGIGPATLKELRNEVSVRQGGVTPSTAPAAPPRQAPPAASPPAPPRPAMPGHPVPPAQPAAPPLAKPPAPAAPARPAMPGKPASPAVPVQPPPGPSAPPPVPDAGRPVAPAKPAGVPAPARPAGY